MVGPGASLDMWNVALHSKISSLANAALECNIFASNSPTWLQQWNNVMSVCM